MRVILFRLLRPLRGLLRRSRVVDFYQSPSLAKPLSLNGKLIEVDSAQFETWARTLPTFPWPHPALGRSRLNATTKLFALIEKDKPVCLGWVTSTDSFYLNELGRSCAFDPKVEMVWDCVTLIGERRKGYFTRFLQQLQARFPTTTFTIFCQSDNLGSAGAIGRAGFVRWISLRRGLVGTRVKVFPGATGGLRLGG